MRIDKVSDLAGVVYSSGKAYIADDDGPVKQMLRDSGFTAPA